MEEKLKLFISYSHQDEEYANQFITHIAILKDNGLIELTFYTFLKNTHFVNALYYNGLQKSNQFKKNLLSLVNERNSVKAVNDLAKDDTELFGKAV